MFFCKGFDKTPAKKPISPMLTICSGVHGPLPKKKFDIKTDRAPTRKPVSAPVSIPLIMTSAVRGFSCGMNLPATASVMNTAPKTRRREPILLLSKPLQKSKAALIIYGVLCGIFYSMFMDIWTTCSATGSLEFAEYLKSVAAAIPFTVIYSVSNVIYLLLLAPPFQRKLGRIAEKYGL